MLTMVLVLVLIDDVYLVGHILLQLSGAEEREAPETRIGEIMMLYLLFTDIRERNVSI
jgi:hypothetical protein